MAEVWEEISDWVCRPEGSDEEEVRFAHVEEMWLKPGTDEAWNELVKEFCAFFEEIGFSYQVVGHRVRIGGTGRVVFVSFFDDKGAYYGARGIEALAEGKGAIGRWYQLLGKFGELVDRYEYRDVEMEPDLTYWPSS